MDWEDGLMNLEKDTGLSKEIIYTKYDFIFKKIKLGYSVKYTFLAIVIFVFVQFSTAYIAAGYDAIKSNYAQMIQIIADPFGAWIISTSIDNFEKMFGLNGKIDPKSYILLKNIFKDNETFQKYRYETVNRIYTRKNVIFGAIMSIIINSYWTYNFFVLHVPYNLDPTIVTIYNPTAALISIITDRVLFLLFHLLVWTALSILFRFMYSIWKLGDESLYRFPNYVKLLKERAIDIAKGGVNSEELELIKNESVSLRKLKASFSALSKYTYSIAIKISSVSILVAAFLIYSGYLTGIFNPINFMYLFVIAIMAFSVLLLPVGSVWKIINIAKNETLDAINTILDMIQFYQFDTIITHVFETNFDTPDYTNDYITVKNIGNEIAAVSSSPISMNQFMSVLAATVLPIISVIANTLLKAIFGIEIG